MHAGAGSCSHCCILGRKPQKLRHQLSCSQQFHACEVDERLAHSVLAPHREQKTCKPVPLELCRRYDASELLKPVLVLAHKPAALQFVFSFVHFSFQFFESGHAIVHAEIEDLWMHGVRAADHDNLVFGPALAYKMTHQRFHRLIRWSTDHYGVRGAFDELANATVATTFSQQVQSPRQFLPDFEFML